MDETETKAAVKGLQSVYLPPPSKPGQIKTLIFDLDETLTHCLDTEDPSERQAAGIDPDVE